MYNERQKYFLDLFLPVKIYVTACDVTYVDDILFVLGDDDFKAYRFNKDKALSWLKLKVCLENWNVNICLGFFGSAETFMPHSKGGGI